MSVAIIFLFFRHELENIGEVMAFRKKQTEGKEQKQNGNKG